MNSKENSTTAAGGATAKHTQALETLNELFNGIGGIDGKINDLVHASHFLASDLEFKLNFGRGQDCGTGGIRLVFQKSGIDATNWLLSSIYSDIRDLHELATKARVIIDDLDLSFPGGAVPVVGRAAA